MIEGRWKMRASLIPLAALAFWAVAAASGEERIGAPAPVRLDADKLAGLGLEEYEPYPQEMVLSGRSRHSYHTFFSGEEVVVEVYEAEPAKLRIDEPWPYDEPKPTSIDRTRGRNPLRTGLPSRRRNRKICRQWASEIQSKHSREG